MLGLASSGALAHGAGARAWTGPLSALEFTYTTGEPISDTGVLLSAPDGSVRHRGRTDSAGRYAFASDAAGTWTARLDDGLGHVVEAQVTVQDDGRARVLDGGRPLPLSQSVLLGLLVLSALGNLVQYLRRTRSGPDRA